jgi:hypothetical protein
MHLFLVLSGPPLIIQRSSNLEHQTMSMMVLRAVRPIPTQGSPSIWQVDLAA